MFSQIQKQRFNNIADQYVERINDTAYLYYFEETKRTILDTLLSYFGKSAFFLRSGSISDAEWEISPGLSPFHVGP